MPTLCRMGMPDESARLVAALRPSIIELPDFCVQQGVGGRSDRS